MTTNYFRNLLLTTANNQFSEEQWVQQKPDIKHFCTFRCLIYIHIPKKNQSKLDKISWQKIFVRYHFSNQY